MTQRIATVAVVGSATVAPRDRSYRLARRLGEALVQQGFRVITGGRTGVMEAACRGAHDAESYTEGRTVGVLPGHDPDEANRWVDVVLPTGLSIARNAIIAHSDGLVAVGGGSGTLSEVAMAWKLGRPIIALEADGISQRIAGEPIDDRPGPEDDQIWSIDSPVEAARLMERLVKQAATARREIR